MLTTGAGEHLAHFDHQADAGTLLTVNRYVDEGRDADEIESAGRHIAPCDGDRLDRLIDCPGPDRLHLYLVLGAHDTCNRAGDCDRLARCGDFEDFQSGCGNSGASWETVCCDDDIIGRIVPLREPA